MRRQKLTERKLRRMIREEVDPSQMRQERVEDVLRLMQKLSKSIKAFRGDIEEDIGFVRQAVDDFVGEVEDTMGPVDETSLREIEATMRDLNRQMGPLSYLEDFAEDIIREVEALSEHYTD